MKKTNALRLLDSLKIEYLTYEYNKSDGIDGLSVAKSIKKDPNIVFKTLVCKSDKDLFVFIVPVDKTLNLKKAAKAVRVKKIEMLPLKDLLSKTGYVHGGCSPIGMKKRYLTVIDETAVLYDSVVFSAGLIGMQVEIMVEDLEKIDIEMADLV